MLSHLRLSLKEVVFSEDEGERNVILFLQDFLFNLNNQLHETFTENFSCTEFLDEKLLGYCQLKRAYILQRSTPKSELREGKMMLSCNVE